MRTIIGRRRRSRRSRRRETVGIKTVGPRIIGKRMGRDTSVLHVDHKIAALRIPDHTGVGGRRTQGHGVRIIPGHGSYYFEHVCSFGIQTPGRTFKLVGRPLMRVLVQIPALVVDRQIQTALPGPFFKSVWWWTPDAVPHSSTKGLGAVVFGLLRVDLVPALLPIVVDVAHARRGFEVPSTYRCIITLAAVGP
jgi:hypothetical protein